MDLTDFAFEPLRNSHEEFALYRGRARQSERPSVLLLTPSSSRPARESLKKLEHQYSFRDELDGAWAVRPLALSKYKEQQVLVLEDPGGEPLDGVIEGPMEMLQFLRLALGLASALSHLHKRNVIHKNVKPGNFLVDSSTGHAWLMGFGIASRLLRERQSPEPPEFIAGTLPYMAPEQTGRMNRSIDSRSDLYAFGIVLYEMLTGSRPFTASDPMGWVHCQIARQPVPPHELQNAPRAVSAIIMRLLAKTPEERYQTAAGVHCDLRRCLAEWESQGRIQEFVPGKQDTPDRLVIPEKLYGRAHEIETLLSAFDRVVAGRRPELVLVSGYSGIGKSALVNELHKPLVPPRGLFASGKFDQYKRDIPYATLAQAFQSLIRPLLSKSEEELSKWRKALREALDPNGLLIVDLVPELKLIIGEQSPVPELPLQAAQSRFQLVFRRFITVFARPEHPLALFLDDLQWLDAATLDLMEDLLTRTDLQHLMLIGAYRDNEVNSAHPLIRKLEAMRRSGAILQDIVLAPLALEHLGQLIAESLGCDLEGASPLAQLIETKTGGNPFFAIQFFSALAEEGLLTFDYDDQRWSWDLNRIHAKGYTDNVVDLMVRKLIRLPAETQKALQQLACLGNSAEFAILRIVYHDSEEDLHGQLWEGVRQGLIFRSEESYKFLHDRVQEAAYSLIPEELRAEAHLRIGRLLAAYTPPERLEEGIFEIVNQLNRGSHLVTSTEERERVAKLNFIAGKRAKVSTAYASALRLLAAGRSLLTDETWDSNYDLIFSIEYLTAECELLTADMAAAEDRLSMLAQRAKNAHDMAIVTRLRLTLYTTLDRSNRGVELCLEYLRHLGTDWSPTPTREEVMREHDRIRSLVGNRQIEELVDLPLMTDPAILDVLDVLTEAVTPSMYCDENLFSLVICHMVNLSLEYGNCDGSCFAYVWFAVIAGPYFGEYKDGFRFGRLGCELVEKRGLIRYQARTYMSFGNMVIPYARHALEGRELARRAFDAAYRIGDLTFAAYSRTKLITNFLTVGDPLAEVQPEAEKGLEFAQSVRFGLVIDLLIPQVKIIQTLRGLTPKFGSFDDGSFDESEFERHLASNPTFGLPEFWYCSRKVQARFFAADYATAVNVALRAQRLIYTSPSQLETADLRFYGALSHAAYLDSASVDQRPQHLEALTAHHRELKIWAEHCPENFENRAALVGAEIARIEGRILDAEQLYEKAIRSARENGFVHNEALANEVAARFYMERGFEKIAYVYLQDARYGYLRWGATGKVQQLDALYPRLRQSESVPGSSGAIGTSVEQLDLATVIKVSQAVSSEMVLEKLIDSLMRAALEHAGAERALLISSAQGELKTEAEATTAEGNVVVNLGIDAGIAAAIPESLIRYVMRTRESVIVKDGSSPNPFSVDPYIAQRRPRSILTMPLINRGKLISILHLENNLTPDVFTPDRIIVLKLLASQAAISLENSRLYRDIESRERKIGRLIDSNIIGVVIWDMDGRLLDANDAFLRMLGYDREDVKAGLRWFDMTPREWQEVHARYEADELAATGMMQAREKEYFRKDGSRVPVLIGAACFEDQPNQGVAYILDLTRQKQAEEALRRSEAHLTQAQRLAHVGSWVWQVAGPKVVHLSEECYRVYGFDPHGGIPTWQERLDRVHPEDRAKWQATIDRAIDQKADYEMEFRVLPPHSAVRYIHSVGSPVFGPSGEVVQYVGVDMDVTDRKQADEAFRHIVVGTAATTGSDFFQSLVQHVAQALHARYAFVTACDDQKHARSLAFWKGDHLGENFDWDISDTPCEKVLHGDVCHYRQGLHMFFPRDKFLADWRAESYLGVPMLDGGNRVIGHIAILDDKPMEADSRAIDLLKIFASRAAAELKRQKAEDELQAALEERERMREELSHLAHLNRVSTMGELTASLGHEIKQPIAAALTDAKTCLRWLSRDQPDVPEARDAASRVVKDATHASEIINRIGSLFKKGPLQRELIEVNQLIQEMIALLRIEADRHLVAFHIELSEGLPKINADRVQIQQVLMNLMLNGIEAMKDIGYVGELTIKSQKEGDAQILVSVRDTGVGLCPEYEKQIFNAFFTTKPGGTGMGLAISRSIIESHGGRLWATSNDGAGATFRFTLPIESSIAGAMVSGT
ncbi:AAA family ATPase [Occallatibacter riparius]|uniref:histidine kinase n=1 Tax=Occallatibacter riparius TaxID=1002689 RepID=A0A9J7BWE4_9BACT|nr:AAA family ATPase [Occallatibacter riparius]UWZ85206.1 AAA family ATPase [Occallatibacter riparius]